MKLKLHSQSQPRGWILHWSTSNYGKKLWLVTFLPFPVHVSVKSWLISLWWTCAQYFQMVINPLSCCTELGGKLLISPTDAAVDFSDTQELLPVCLYLSLQLLFFHSALSFTPFKSYLVVFSLSVPGSCLLFRIICSMQVVDMPVSVLRCVSSACLCAGHQNCLSGAQHSRSRGWDSNAEGKRFTQHRGQRRGDQTDGGLQEPL